MSLKRFENSMTARKPKFKIILNPELIAAGRSFVPEFGNKNDLVIIDRIMNLERDLGSVDNHILREVPKKHTSVMKRILREEQDLIRSITQRNNDF
jgi:hypothetical protein